MPVVLVTRRLADDRDDVAVVGLCYECVIIFPSTAPGKPYLVAAVAAPT
jgi:hypothetical protein